jgi:translocation and assembly module TamB
MLGAFGAVRAFDLRERAQTEIVHALSESSGMRVRVRSAALELGGPWLVARGVELDDAQGRAVLRAAALRARASLTALFGGGLGLRSLELSGAQITLHADAFPDAKQRRDARWPFDALVLHDASVRVELAPGSALALEHAELKLESRGSGMHVHGNGGEVAFEQDGAVVLQGALRADVQLEGPAALRAEGRVELEHARVPAYDLLQRAALQVRADHDRVALSGPLELRGLGQLEVALTWTRGAGVPLALGLKPRALRFAALASRFGWQEPWLDAELTGELDLHGALAPLALSGHARLDASALQIGRARAGSEPIWRAERAQISADVKLDTVNVALDALQVTLGKSVFRGDVHAGPGRISAGLGGDAVELGDVSPLAGVTLGGHGSLQLSVDGALQSPALRAELAIEDGSVASIALGHVAALVHVEDGGARLRFERAEIANRTRRVSADDLLVDLHAEPKLETHLRVGRLPLDELYRVIGAEEDPVLSRLQGVAEGRAEFSVARAARGAAFVLGLALDLHEAKLDGYAFENGRLRARIDVPDTTAGIAGGTVTLDQLTLGTGSGKLELSGAMARGVLDLALGLDALPLARLPWVVQHAPGLSATLHGKGKVSGNSADPRADVELALEGVRVAQFELGRAQLHARLAPGPRDCSEQSAREAPADPRRGGASLWTICGQALRSRARLELTLTSAAPRTLHGSFNVDRLELDPYLPQRANGKPLHGTISAVFELASGNLAQPDQLSGALSVSHLELGEGEAKMTSKAPFELRVKNGVLSASDAELIGSKLRFKLGADGALHGGARLFADGTAAASLWAGLHPLVQPFGDVRIHVETKLGSGAGLRAELEPQNVFVRIGEDVFARKVSGKIVLDAGKVQLSNVSAELGGGTLTLGGELTMDGFALDRYDVALGARGIALEPQPRFELTFDGDGRLRGGGSSPPELKGKLRIKRLLYGRHIEFPGALMVMNQKQRAESANYDAQRNRIAVDVTIEHDEPLHVRNNFLDADVVVTGEPRTLRLVGTDQRLGLVGKLSIQRGRVLFRGDEFRVTRGDVAFDETDRIDPNFDIRAQAQGKKQPNSSILFTAHGNRDQFAVRVRCDSSKPSEARPFACDYAGDKFHCDEFDKLVQVWMCRPKTELSSAE